ncbi:hypothetical protein EVAR_36230_1 [Eumeta japonica]|uniref:Uncharacterized protein n=1 Tax=Eumeta variegata TaxID=151549 RepID=A0A4C1WZH3_EUMVA|nr:hypothetical protein EVAR_36230_1 [Eumeta japonica]
MASVTTGAVLKTLSHFNGPILVAPPTDRASETAHVGSVMRYEIDGNVSHFVHNSVSNICTNFQLYANLNVFLTGLIDKSINVLQPSVRERSTSPTVKVK